MPTEAEIRERAAKLFRFLADLTQLRVRKARDVTESGEYVSVFWLKDLPREPEVYTHAWGVINEQEPWARIDRPEKPSLDDPPLVCSGWYDKTALEDTTVEPKFFDKRAASEQVTRAGAPQTISELLERRRPPTVAWEKYLSEKWRPWKAGIERWDAVQQSYRQLFKIHQEQERRGEQYELLLGVGTLLSTSPSGHRVCRPILTTRATLSLERESGRLELTPSEDGGGITLEQDMLEVSEQPTSECQAEIEKKTRELESLWDQETVPPILKAWFHSLPCGEGLYSDSLELPARSSDRPVMAFSPVLMLRKRRMRGIYSALKQAEKSISDGVEIPQGLREICGESREQRRETRLEAAGLPEETLFPLPTNDEQERILSRLPGRAGVLVQGPPGTGKSHTIVNLVCHFLAHGKRVLVTSQTARALRVLENKFPAEVLPLVVSVIDEKEDSRRNLERSVNSILRAVDDPDYDCDKLNARIAQLALERTKARAKLADLVRRQRELREADADRYEIPGTCYSGSPQQIAVAVERDGPRFEWLVDEVPESAVAPPLAPQELPDFLHLLGEFGSNPEAFAAWECVQPDELPTPESFSTKVAQWRATQANAEQFSQRAEKETVVPLIALSCELLTELQHRCRQWLRIHADVAQRNDWRSEILTDILSGKVAAWKQLADETESVLQTLSTSFRINEEPIVETDTAFSTIRLLADAEDLLAHVRGRRTFGLWFLRPAVVRRTRYLWWQTRVDGRQCSEIVPLERLVSYLRARSLLERMERAWGQVPSNNTATLHQRESVLAERCAALQQMLHLDDIATDVRQHLTESPIGVTALSSPGAVQELAMSLEGACAAHREHCCRREVEGMVTDIVEAATTATLHPFNLALIEAVSDRNVEAYRKAYEDIAAAFKRHLDASRCVELNARLAASLPQLAMRVRDSDERERMAAKATDFESAWNWRRAIAWLDRYDREHLDTDLLAGFVQTESMLQDLTAKSVARRAWLACLNKLTPQRQSAMKAWAHTVVQIGRGTGRHAETYRRQARAYLTQCWDAIPAHVMPLFRVAEQFRFDQPEMFDVVIVDESSQTGPEGLLLTFLGKQCIVVGDDEQISPEEGFIDKDEVLSLQKEIADIPFADRLTPGESLFHQADIRYGTRVSLREHFRCMPEIIQFSNSLCYVNEPLLPLRQYPAERLTPLVDRFVTDGYREGTSERTINRPEAAALAKAVVECLGNPAYRKKSFGVICLQGHAQAKLIEQMLLERVGPEPFKDPARRLLCGDPYSFQGDERDVVFLSMVAAADGDSRNGLLSDKKYEQRFNVAASRAADQMWLFHSVREGDLHPQCVRRKLVQFMSRSPELLAPTVRVEYVRDRTAHARRGVERAPEPFDSWFEVDVFLALLDCGFRVLPQFPVAGKRIDLVVEDACRRAAVECDGDEWHGPDAYEADSQRQRKLERCHWQFVRVRASSFYAQRAKAVEWLTRELERIGVQPWSPPSDGAVYHAIDRAEVSGAACLAWLGTQITEAAESGLSQVDVRDDDPNSGATDALPVVLPSLHQRELVDIDPAGPQPAATESQTAVDGAVDQRQRQNRASERPKDQEGERPTCYKRLFEIIAILFDSIDRPLSRAQLQGRIRISDETWPDIEAELLGRGLVHKNALSKRFSLAVPLPPLTAAANQPLDSRTTDGQTWLQIAAWAQETRQLLSIERQNAYWLGLCKLVGIAASDEHLHYGKGILEQCKRLGFFNRP